MRGVFFVLLLLWSGCEVSETFDTANKHDGDTKISEIEEAIRDNKYDIADSLIALVVEKASATGNQKALIDAKNQKASVLFDRNRLDESLEVIKQNMERIDEHGTSIQKVVALIQLTNIYFSYNRNEESLMAVNEAYQLLDDLDDLDEAGHDDVRNVQQRKAAVYATRATVLADKNPVEALEMNYEALDVFKELEDRYNEAILRNNLGLIFHDRGDYEEALEEYELAIRINRDIDNYMELARNYNNIANSLSETGNYEAAADSLLKAVAINEERGNVPSLIRNYYNLGDIYVNIENLDEAHSYYLQGYDKSRSMNFTPGVMYHAAGLANLLVLMEEFDRVQDYIDEARSIATQIENLDVLKGTWDIQMRLEEALGHYKAALDASRNSQDYADRLDSIRRQREFEDIRMAYEVDLKTAENELLRQELNYQERISSSQKVILILLFIGVIITSVFLVLLTRNERKRKKAFSELKENNKLIIRKNKQLKSLNKELKQLNTDKDHLVDVIIHDLRNPLFGVIGFLEVIDESITDKSTRDHLRMALTSAYRLNQQVDNLLEVHALEKEERKVVIEKIHIDKLVRESVENFRERAGKKDISINLKVDSFEVDGNDLYFRRIVDNILSNAIKFSPPHSRVFVEVRQINNQFWQLVIADEGPGFSVKDKKNMFQMFGKLSAQPTGGEVSTGLGLYAIKILVERLNGMITVDSEQGKGSSFICEFPVKQEHESADQVKTGIKKDRQEREEAFQEAETNIK